LARTQAGIRLRARLAGTYRTAPPMLRIERIVQLSPTPDLAQRSEALRASIEHYLEHRFDLLGSGWVDVGYDDGCRPPAAFPARWPCLPGDWLNGRRASAVWGLVDADYRPIDWHRDSLSGFRWDARCWHSLIPIAEDGHGTDIKFPWELARCQHMPQLALFSAGAGKGDKLSRAAARSFRNQVLDFVANNPPGYGVNWRCAMDVGIRAANWLLAFDLFQAAGTVFDEVFERVFAGSVLDHAQHVCENLEWTDSGRSNHYLADVVSLVVMSAYLKAAPSMAAVGDWALAELMVEMVGQFDESGANREASTCYHRLGAELAIYGAAFGCWLARQPPLHDIGPRPFRPIHETGDAGDASVIRERIGREGLPTDVVERLYGMGRFVLQISRSDGTVPQVGDNDSGRLFRVSAVVTPASVAQARARYVNLQGYRTLPDDASFPIEVMLDHRHIPAALCAFFPDEPRFRARAPDRTEALLLSSIIGASPVPMQHVRRKRPGICGADGDLARLRDEFRQADPASRQEYVFALPSSEGSRPGCVHAHASFGLFVLSHADYHLAFRCGPAERYGSGSHLHHDQLSIDLVIGGHPVALDPGSFVYTRYPIERERYRSLRAHFAPWPVMPDEPGDGDPLFAMPSFTGAHCLYYRADGLAGRYRTGGATITRVVEIREGSIHVLDYSDALPLARCPFVGTPQRFAGLPFSDRYGGQMR
jgi:hypothetical protein